MLVKMKKYCWLVLMKMCMKIRVLVWSWWKKILIVLFGVLCCYKCFLIMNVCRFLVGCMVCCLFWKRFILINVIWCVLWRGIWVFLIFICFWWYLLLVLFLWWSVLSRMLIVFRVLKLLLVCCLVGLVM